MNDEQFSLFGSDLFAAGSETKGSHVSEKPAAPRRRGIIARQGATIQGPWEGCRFIRFPARYGWSCHKHPTKESDMLDTQLNDLQERTFKRTPHERQMIHEHAQKMRYESVRRGLMECKHSDDGHVFIHEIGATGEWATMVYCGLPIVFKINVPREETDLPYRIEVKTRTDPHYDLKVETWRARLYPHHRCVLTICIGLDWPVTLIGWMTAGEAAEFELIDPKDKGEPFHAVPQDKLYSMRSLKELVDKERAKPQLAHV